MRKGITEYTKGIVVINPNNPTGAVADIGFFNEVDTSSMAAIRVLRQPYLRKQDGIKKKVAEKTP